MDSVDDPIFLTANPYLILAEMHDRPVLVNVQTGRIAVLSDKGGTLYQRILSGEVAFSAPQHIADDRLRALVIRLMEEGTLVDCHQVTWPRNEPSFSDMFTPEPSAVHLHFLGAYVDVVCDSALRPQLLDLYEPYVCPTPSICHSRGIVRIESPRRVEDAWLLQQRIADLSIYVGKSGAMLVGPSYSARQYDAPAVFDAFGLTAATALECARICIDTALDRVLQRQTRHCVHSAAVRLGNHTVLLIGESATGKTSVLLELVRQHGGIALADDCVYVSDGYAHGYLPCLLKRAAEASEEYTLGLLPPAKKVLRARDVPSDSNSRFVPDVVVVLRRTQGRTTLGVLSRGDTAACVARLALCPPHAALQHAATPRELQRRFASITRVLQQASVMELQHADDVGTAASLLVGALGHHELAVATGSRRLAATPATSDCSVVPPMPLDDGQTPSSAVIEAFGHAVQVFGDPLLIDSAISDYGGQAVGGLAEQPIYNIQVRLAGCGPDATDYSVEWEAPALGVRLLTSSTERCFAFMDGGYIRHMSRSPLSVVEAPDPASAYPLLRAAITHVAQRLAADRGWITLHAGLVAADGRGLVIIGPRGAGKTVCCLRLSQSGYDFITDELVAIDTTAGQLRATGLRRSPSVRADVAGRFDTTESLQLPFGRELKHMVNNKNDVRSTPWVGISRILRVSVCDLVECHAETLPRHIAVQEVFNAGVGDCGDTSLELLQQTTFRICDLVPVDALYLSRDLDRSAAWITSRYGEVYDSD